MLAYSYDTQGIYTETVEFDSMGPVPRNSILVPPPELVGTEVARRVGNGWEVLPERPPVPEPPIEEVIAATIADYENRVQQRLDGFARTLTYDSMLSACTYATSKIDVYRIEGQYCVDARDSTWAVVYGLMQDIVPAVLSGGSIPSWEEIEAQLPPLAWPEGSRGYMG